MDHKKNTIKKLFSILFVMFFFLVNAQNTFIENKGQFPKAVISKTYLPSGALYVEKAKLTYAFYNGKQLADIHDGSCNVTARSFMMIILTVGKT